MALLQREPAPPYENPTPLANFLQMLAIFLIPAAWCSRSPHGRRYAAGGGARGDDLAVRRLGAIVTPPGQAGNPQFAALGGRQAQSIVSRAATWKARRRASASHAIALFGHHDGRIGAAP